MWNQSYTYDGFGNLLTKSYAGGSPNPSPAVNFSYSAKNQITNSGYTYDGNGNLQCAGSSSNCATYNVENRMVYSGPYGSQTVYAYDPSGKRVMVNSGGASGTYTWTFYGITGQPLAILQCNASSFPGYPTCAIAGQNVYFGGRMIVSGGVNVATDRLGTIRANAQGESFAYYPYGEERTNTVNSRPKFGTYFRDAVGQDYADQRYYNEGMGRFWSPDPYRPSSQGDTPPDPQSWNRYSYTEGDSINYFDPTGQDRINCLYVPTDIEGNGWEWECSPVPNKRPTKPITFTNPVRDPLSCDSDVTADSVNKFIAGYTNGKASDLVGQGAAFVNFGRKCDVDPRIVVALAGIESAMGTKTTTAQNDFGYFWKGFPTPSPFSSIDSEIQSVTHNVQYHINDLGQTDPADIYYGNQWAYCNSGCDLKGFLDFLKAQGADPAKIDLRFPCDK